MKQTFSIFRFKTILAAAALLLSFSTFGAGALTPEFGKCRLKADSRQGSFWIFGPDNKLSAGAGVFPKSEFPNFKTELKDNTLVIDTRGIYKSGVAGRSMILRFYGIDLKTMYLAPSGKKNHTKTNRVSVELKSETPSDLSLYFEGQQTINGREKHYYVSKSVVLNGKWQTISLDQVLPDNLKKVWIRITLRKPAKIAIRRVTVEQVPLEEKKLDPTVNYIRNGGAESGWNGIVYNALRNYQLSSTGKYINFRRKEVKSELKFSLDTETKYEGSYSFCIERPAGNEVNGALRFHPVPYVVGKPVSFSFYAKAEKPQRLYVSYFLASGIATGTNIAIGTEWKKYEFYIPAWGEKRKNITIIGDIVNGYAKPTGVAIPSIQPSLPGKVWIDNVAHTIGGHAEYRNTDPIFLCHKLNKDTGYFFTDETIKADVTIRNTHSSPFHGELSYTILNVFGTPVLQKTIGKVTVPAKGIRKESVTISPPPTLRGPFNTVFRIKGNGKEYSDTAYLGVIEQNTRLNPRIGVEVSGMQNVEMAIGYLRDFRIGSVRIGQASGNLQTAFANAPYLKKAGFQILINMSPMHKAATDPALWNTEMEKIGKLMAEHGRWIDVFEVKNEPNISPGWTVGKNLQMIGEVAELMKRHNLKADLAGPVTCGTDFTWIASVLAGKEAEHLTIVTEHPYRTLPELPDYADDTETLRKIIDHSRKGLPHFATESGRVSPCQLETGFIEDNNRLAAARDIRNIIQGFSGGLARYYHFAMSVWPEGSSWNTLFAGSPGNNGVPVPNPTLYALRTLSDRLEQAKCVRRVKLGVDYRCSIFDHGNKRTAVLWKWNGNPGALRFRPEEAGKWKAFDFVGSSISAAAIPMNEYPVYLDSALSAEELEKVIRRGTLIADGSSPIALSSAVLSEKEFAVEVKNKTGKTLKGIRISIDTPELLSGESVKNIASIEPEASARVTFSLKNSISTTEQKVKASATLPGLKEKASLDADLRALLVRRTAKPIRIDGDLSDWPAGIPVVTLDKRNVDPKCRSEHWSAKEDRIRAELRYAWDDNYLYTAVTVWKSDFHPLADQKELTAAWKQDSIQVCYDTLRNAKPFTTALEDDDFEYCLFQCAGQPLTTRRWASSAVHDSLPKNCGVVDPLEVPFAVKKYKDRIVYEAAFSRRAVSPFKLRPYSTMRASLIINLNNGKERVGFLELTPGIGQQPKRPDQWMDLVLLP